MRKISKPGLLDGCTKSRRFEPFDWEDQVGGWEDFFQKQWASPWEKKGIDPWEMIIAHVTEKYSPPNNDGL